MMRALVCGTTLWPFAGILHSYIEAVDKIVLNNVNYAKGQVP